MSRTFEFELAGFDLGEIQNVVDHGQQRGGAVAHGLRIVELHGVERRFQQQLDHADDAVHRRANLVAHVGEEFALGFVRRCGSFRRLDQRQLIVLPLR